MQEEQEARAAAEISTVGACVADGGGFAGSDAVAGSVKDFVPVDLHIRGCPPTPIDLLSGLRAE